MHLLQHRDTIIRAVHTVDSGIHNFTANETWSRVKIHGVPLARYLGRGTFGLDKLRAELEAENKNLEIPMVARWLGRVPDIKDRSCSEKIRASSVTFVI